LLWPKTKSLRYPMTAAAASTSARLNPGALTPSIARARKGVSSRAGAGITMASNIPPRTTSKNCASGLRKLRRGLDHRHPR